MLRHVAFRALSRSAALRRAPPAASLRRTGPAQVSVIARPTAASFTAGGTRDGDSADAVRVGVTAAEVASGELSEATVVAAAHALTSHGVCCFVGALSPAWVAQAHAKATADFARTMARPFPGGELKVRWGDYRYLSTKGIVGGRPWFVPPRGPACSTVDVW